MPSRRYKANKGSFSQKLTKFLFTTGLVLFAGGYFGADGLLENVFPTQNPLVAIPAAFAVYVFGWGMLVGAAVLLLAAILWLLTAQNKDDQLLALFGLSGLPMENLRAFLKDLRALLNDWRFLAVIVPIIAIGLALIFGLGTKDGTYTELDENGQTKLEQVYYEGHKVSETAFVDGLPSLVSKWSRTSPNKVSEESYVDGELVRTVSFLPNGNIWVEKNYVNGLLDGPHLEYSNDGLSAQENTYVGGERVGGAQIKFHANGQLRQEFRILGSVDTTTMWYESGQMRYEAVVTGEDRNGSHKLWYENGQLKEEAGLSRRKVHGLKTTWFDTGQKMAEANFVNGRQIGLETAWEKEETEAEIEARQLVARDVSDFAVPTNGLLAYYQFEMNGEDSVHVGSLDLKTESKVFYTERSEGNHAVHFKGWGSFAAESRPFQLKEALTIALWVKFTELPERWSAGKLISNSTKGADLPPDRRFWSGYWIDVIPNVRVSSPRYAQIMHPRFFTETNIGDSPEEKRNELTADRPIKVHEWSHIAVVFDGIQKAIYVNGELSGTQNAAPDAREIDITYASTSEFQIGSWEEGEFSGELDDILIYSRPLSQDEIRTIYLETK